MTWQDDVESIRETDSSLATNLKPMRFLDDLIRWGKNNHHDASQMEFVSQDEFTIDVVLALEPDRWLVFDCT